jgi:hypothetical protein
VCPHRLIGRTNRKLAKVFWFFFSKKNYFFFLTGIRADVAARQTAV